MTTVADVSRAELAHSVVNAEPLDLTRHVARSPWALRYRGLLVLGDALVAALVPLAIAMVGLGRPQVVLVLGLPAAWLAVGALWGSYDADLLAPPARELRKVGLTAISLLAALPVFGFVTGQRAREDLALGAVAVTAAAVVGVRSIARTQLRSMRRAGRCAHRVVVAGDPDAAEELVRRIHASNSAVITPVALALPEHSRDIGDMLGLPALGRLDEPDALVASIIATGADAVVLVPGPGADAAELRRLARGCEWAGVRLLFAPSVVDVAASAPVVPVAGVPVLRVPRPGPAGAGRFVKEVMDRLGAGAGLLLLAPVLAVVALAVKIDSPGPALFRQVRVGAGGRRFRMIKFRSMTTDAETHMPLLRDQNEMDGPLFKMSNDPRVTRIGKFLRRSSIDELPQLLNVLWGHMSLVGPRPPLPSEVADYTDAERRRLLVKPGLTGLWQVGGRASLPWQDSVRLDLGYVESWSVPLDLRILAQTVPAVLRRHGAY